jgi:hypothetical protein
MATNSVLPNIVNNQGLTALDLAVLATDKGISYTLVSFTESPRTAFFFASFNSCSRSI